MTIQMKARVGRSGPLSLAAAILVFCAETCCAQILMEAPEDASFYKLSNLQVSNGILGEVISFDYVRKREGSGDVYLAGRTDSGVIRISGYSDPIRESGTIRLSDRTSGMRGIFSRGYGSGGIEFYFVTGGPTYTWGLTPSEKRYLVSNTIRHGTLNTKISPKKLTKEDREEAALAKKRRLPPEDLPKGYTRGTALTRLVPGAPVLYGRLGEWARGTVASLPSNSTAKIKPEGSNVLATVNRKDWVAVADKVAKQIESQPQKFKVNFQTLPGGNLVLGEGIEPIGDASRLVKGVPVIFEKYSKWVDAHFLSSDNVSVRLLTREHGNAKVEFIPFEKVAIRTQTLKDLKSRSLRDAYAANVAFYEQNLRKGSMQSPSGFGRKSPPPSQTTARIEKDLSPAPIRKWKDATGKFEIEARLQKEEDSSVFLERPDGRVVKVPTEKLSDVDLEYLKTYKATPKPSDNPFENVVESPKEQSPFEAGELASYDSPFVQLSKVSDTSFGPKSVAISPDNKFLLVGRNSSSASLCDIRTGQILIDSGRMDHLGNVGVCGFSPNGKHAVLCGYKGIVEVYEFSASGKMQLLTQFAMHTKEVTSLSFSRDSKFAMTGGDDDTAYCWEVTTGTRIATLKGFKGKVKATHISMKNDVLHATDGEKLIGYQVSTAKVFRDVSLTRSRHSGQAAAFSPNGQFVAVGDSYDIRVWDLEDMMELPRIKGNEIAWSIIFSPDNRHVLSGGNGVVNVWNSQDQSRALSILVGKNFYVQALATSSTGDLIACPSEHNGVVVLQPR